MVDFLTHDRQFFLQKNIQNICGHKSKDMW